MPLDAWRRGDIQWHREESASLCKARGGTDVSGDLDTVTGYCVRLGISEYGDERRSLGHSCEP